tara:strand:- start:178 stop:660 length:483 start_codon:yes stop_codon:yes gene_type:complete
MGAEALSNRTNWQMGARISGDAGERTFAAQVAPYLGAQYVVQHRPPKLKIYSEEKGIKLDTRITNTVTGLSLYIENKEGNNGGNAHERVYKFLSPALKRVVRETFNTVENPFFLVFSGRTFQGQKYKDEINLLCEGENYAIMTSDYENIQEVANQIMEIV